MKSHYFLENVLNTVFVAQNRKFGGSFIRPALTPDILPYSQTKINNKDLRSGWSNRVRAGNFHLTNEPSLFELDRTTSGESNPNLNNEIKKNENYVDYSLFNTIKNNSKSIHIDKVKGSKVNSDKILNKPQPQQKEQERNLLPPIEDDPVDFKSDTLPDNLKIKSNNNDKGFNFNIDNSNNSTLKETDKLFDTNTKSGTLHPPPPPQVPITVLRSPSNYINNIYNSSNKINKDQNHDTGNNNNIDFKKKYSTENSNYLINQNPTSIESNLNLNRDNNRITTGVFYDEKKVLDVHDLNIDKVKGSKVNSDKILNKPQPQQKEQERNLLPPIEDDPVDFKSDTLPDNLKIKSNNNDKGFNFNIDNSNNSTLKETDKLFDTNTKSETLPLHPPHFSSINRHKLSPTTNDNIPINYKVDPTVTINIERIILKGKYGNNIKSPGKQVQNNNSKGLSLNDYLNKRDNGKI